MNDELRLAVGLFDAAETDDDVTAAYGLVSAAKYSADDMRKLGAKGHAFKNPDGTFSYPIEDAEDLTAAIRAVGRGGASHDAIRKYIMGRAKAMGKADAIPDSWNADGSIKTAGEVEAGGYPNQGTPPDKRLKKNQPKMPTMADEAKVEVLVSEAREYLAGRDATVEVAPVDGIPFTVTWMAATNHPTGDGRTFEHFDLAPLPWPWSTQFSLDEGHDGAVVTGRVTHATLSEDGIVSAAGVYMLTDDGLRAAQLAAEKAMPGCSINGDESYEMSIGDDGQRVYHSVRIRGATQCQIPAFVETNIDVDPADIVAALETIAANAETVVAAEKALVASAPKRWAPTAAMFDNPQFGDGPDDDARLVPYEDASGRHAGFAAPLHLDEVTGRVTGHLAGWNQCHQSYTDVCVRPPTSQAAYSYFHRGEVACADGSVVPVGVLCFDCDHASRADSSLSAQSHYDNTSSVAAYIRCGEDQHGVWFSGVVRPDLPDAKVAMMRAVRAMSGDWRREGGALELVAAQFVPMPGFLQKASEPPATQVMVADGRCMTLIASFSQSRPEVGESLALRKVLAMESVLQPTYEALADAALAAMDD